jgi:potassium-transporting ATPase KdpC subunit
MLEKIKSITGEYLTTCLVLFAVSVVSVGIVYPLVMTGISQVAFNRQANGSIVKKDGKAVGSSLIGQSFVYAKYFHGRPSAAGKGYDAMASGASNLGPTNPQLIKRVVARAIAIRQQNGLLPDAEVPADLVESSASGLDPDISPESAMLQVSRVAKARGLPEKSILDLVKSNTRKRQLGILGEARVNVLGLNMALDGLSH